MIDTGSASRLVSGPMKRSLTPFAALALAVNAWSAPPTPPRLLEKANALPLALDDAFQFRKTKTYRYDPLLQKTLVSQDNMLEFERQRVTFGAVTANDRRERTGQYFTFFWRANRAADLTVRFEFRQANLGAYVQAREYTYAAAKGSFKSAFNIVGDDYSEDGAVTAWRAVLIENGRIVALNQSFLWN